MLTCLLIFFKHNNVPFVFMCENSYRISCPSKKSVLAHNYVKDKHVTFQDNDYTYTNQINFVQIGYHKCWHEHSLYIPVQCY